MLLPYMLLSYFHHDRDGGEDHHDHHGGDDGEDYHNDDGDGQYGDAR